MRVLRAAVMLAAAAALVAPSVRAFDSIPGGPHDEITRAAAEEAGYPSGGIAALVEATRGPDIRDHKLAPTAHKVTSFETTASYSPAHHCDRVPPADSAASFQATLEYAAEQGQAAHAELGRGNASGAVERLGDLLHAVEDCFSHSNAVDLADGHALVAAAAGQGPPPGGLVLTGFQPGAADPERPPGDPYPHGDHAKDNPTKDADCKQLLPDGRTKYQAAHDWATESATLALRGWIQGANATELAALAQVHAKGVADQLTHVHVPAPGWLADVVALAGLAAVRRRAA